MTAEIRAVIVRWRGGDEVQRCLSSLLANAGVVTTQQALQLSADFVFHVVELLAGLRLQDFRRSVRGHL